MVVGSSNIRYSATRKGGKLSVNYHEPTIMEHYSSALFGQSQQAVCTTGRAADTMEAIFYSTMEVINV